MIVKKLHAFSVCFQYDNFFHGASYSGWIKYFVTKIFGVVWVVGGENWIGGNWFDSRGEKGTWARQVNCHLALRHQPW